MNQKKMAAIVLAVLLLAYPLSGGPAYRVYIQNGFGSPNVLLDSGIYTPLEWACRVQPIKRVYFWYVNLWLPAGVHMRSADK